MKEQKAWSFNGFLGLLLILVVIALSAFLLVKEMVFLGIILLIIGVVLATGITVAQPNQAIVVNFFGSYIGTIRESGLWLVIPFSIRKSVSLRVRNFNSVKLKVNDIEGNPIEIAAVVVFRVVDSAKAMFDVDKYEQFVEIQSETALRHVANKYPYDVFEGEGYSLRSNSEEIALELSRELQERLSVAGVEVMEARLTHLAYSTEIASAMLQRQQAAAIISARSKIVEGAVGMVQLAIAQIEQDGIVVLDEERKAAMINNLMVAIVSDRSASPVINTGSLY
ncbi:SPFH domain-containing protein [Paenibacillus radicis (ex Xue et al. 2023)]|uniref:SPFH domain-containing protein n=1 Tax=Paenibacillus radicis (ex Xue et al. 2023) TaxID=2972489 RepID=A0ABT1YD61_9BACL|nr:SPFH domain-containing protein [Paenibacillus radicis (ex Xue et al. 2023)]MCR8629895.1 SPFH domain-containing protein [Paenibacillus radicis (ex Xue et al. 2023)]